MGASFLFTGPDDAAITLLLAHGSGAPMDSAAMNAAANALAAEGLRVARFEVGLAQHRVHFRQPASANGVKKHRFVLFFS